MQIIEKEDKQLKSLEAIYAQYRNFMLTGGNDSQRNNIGGNDSRRDSNGGNNSRRNSTRGIYSRNNAS